MYFCYIKPYKTYKILIINELKYNKLICLIWFNFKIIKFLRTFKGIHPESCIDKKYSQMLCLNKKKSQGFHLGILVLEA